MTQNSPTDDGDGGVEQDIEYRGDDEIADMNGVWPKAIAYKDSEGIAMGFKVGEEPLRGIRVTSEVVVFGTNSKKDLSVTIDHEKVFFYDESGEHPDLAPHWIGEWEDGVLGIEVSGVEEPVSLVRGKEDLPLEVSES